MLPKDGVYELRHAVKNPSPDGRVKHDWRTDKEFPAGLKLVVSTYTSFGEKPNDLRSIEVHKLHGFTSRSIVIHPEDVETDGKYFELIRAMEDISHDNETLFRGVDGYPSEDSAFRILLRLMDSGRITKDEVHSVYRELENEAE